MAAAYTPGSKTPSPMFAAPQSMPEAMTDIPSLSPSMLVAAAVSPPTMLVDSTMRCGIMETGMPISSISSVDHARAVMSKMPPMLPEDE